LILVGISSPIVAIEESYIGSGCTVPITCMHPLDGMTTTTVWYLGAIRPCNEKIQALTESRVICYYGSQVFFVSFATIADFDVKAVKTVSTSAKVLYYCIKGLQMYNTTKSKHHGLTGSTVINGSFAKILLLPFLPFLRQVAQIWQFVLIFI
jgi:hypothetical protein